MSDKPVKGWVKPVLEFGPLLIFFVAYLRLRGEEFVVGGVAYDGFIVATALFIPLILISTALMWFLTGTLSKMQIVTAVLVVVFGGLSVWLNDERFFKMKPTIIYLLFAGVLGLGLLRGRSFLKPLMGELMPMSDAGWMTLTRRLAAFFLVLAIANEAVWRTMSTDAWVNFKTFGLPVAMFAFFILQGRLFQEHGETPPDEG